MKIIKASKAKKQEVLSRTFLVPKHECVAFKNDMKAHGWITESATQLANPEYFWFILVPALEKTAAGIKTKPKTKVKQPVPVEVPTPATPVAEPTYPSYQYRPEHLTSEEVSNQINFANIDTDDPAMDMSSGLASKLNSPEKDFSAHPLLREHAFGQGAPEFVRFMWNPWTGEMLLTSDTARDHSQMLANYKKKLQGKGKNTSPFDAWIRGYFNPKDHSIMLRPWDWPLQGKEQDPLAERVTGSIGNTIKSRLIWLLSKQLGIPAEELSKKTNFYLNDDDLRGMFGSMRRF